jgi:membrane protein
MGLYHKARMRRTAHRLLEFFLALVRRLHEDRGLQTAGSLTYTSLLALVPLITVALALSSAFPAFEHAIEALGRFVAAQLLPEGSARVTRQFGAFADSAARLTTVGLVFLAVVALMLMLTVDEVLNRIFRVQRRRHLAQRLAVYWAVLTLGPVLIGASLSITSFLVGSSLGMLDLGGFAKAVLGSLTFLFTCAALTMLYLVVPFRRIELRHALAGGIVAGVIFEIAKRGFALFVANFPTYTLIYGAFAAIPIFLIWLYLSWVVVLFGATLTAMLPAWRAEHALRADAPGRDLLDALAVLRALARARGVLTVGRIAAQAGLTPERCERVLERCATLGWATRTEKETWLLARDAGAIRVADVVSAFAIDASALRAQAPRALAEHFERAGETLTMTVQDLAAEEQRP